MKIRKIGTNNDLHYNNNEKRKPYKIIFFAVIILSTAAFFGFKYFKKQPDAICLDSDTKVYNEYKDAVVLIKHKYGYFAKIKGKEIQLTTQDAKEETVFGTGFFVDRDGKILTNSHVLQPWNSSDEEQEKSNTAIRNLRLKIASILTTDISEDQYESFIERNWETASAYDENQGEGDYEGEGEETTEEPAGEEFISSNDTETDTSKVATDIAAAIPVKEYVSKEDIEVYVKTVDITVALHDSDDQWLSCEIEKISEDTNIDLGIVRLTDHKTPESVANIINLDNVVEDDTSLNPGQKAIMIGYPLGMDLAMTNSGIKVQLYDGKISKESDGNKIQYSITSTHGASGAPVFNECGQLIAVNFSGVDQVQGFNFGIVAKHIRNF
ncbi:serine protease [Flavobacterium sp. Fl-77]|uniref:Serine protease n=1 Tax=Flavobacterium flavipigmentatum TaxID=2893884 RepID=A0AAJ2SEM2_9FLAO|nr:MULTISPECIES: serine protease [unclassified Flavobacterium]MDX6181117.1 serine protease [Flavobacterium sp. Fl-33]MDX6184718.1 serine protease [Flavobacterium sp. Fl-77]UFH39817.1 serine protease [Flavobacterium sp. F-70]